MPHALEGSTATRNLPSPPGHAQQDNIFPPSLMPFPLLYSSSTGGHQPWGCSSLHRVFAGDRQAGSTEGQPESCVFSSPMEFVHRARPHQLAHLVVCSDGETEVQEGEVTCPGSPQRPVAELETEPRSPESLMSASMRGRNRTQYLLAIEHVLNLLDHMAWGCRRVGEGFMELLVFHTKIHMLIF
ncbi:unnamed protein product [Natator depressus]